MTAPENWYHGRVHNLPVALTMTMEVIISPSKWLLVAKRTLYSKESGKYSANDLLQQAGEVNYKLMQMEFSLITKLDWNFIFHFIIKSDIAFMLTVFSFGKKNSFARI